VPVGPTNRTAVLAVAAARVAHEFVNDAGRNLGVLQPSGEGMTEIMRAAQLHMLQTFGSDGGA
jgi:hypothetical protein